MEDKKFMSLDEFSNEFVKSGEKNFYDFLERKKQEALELGDQELANHIEMIYNQAYEDEKNIMKSYKRKMQGKRKKKKEKYKKK